MYRDPDDYEGSPTPEQQAWLDDIADAKATSKAAVRAVVDTLIKGRRRIPRNGLEAVLESVAEELQGEIAYSAECLEASGLEGRFTAYPDEAFIDAEYERLVDAFRPQVLDCAKLLRDMLRPVATNPATWEGK